MADSRNLPKVDYMMMLQYMRDNDCFNAAEIRGAKVLMSSREAYVESSIGYVEVKRERSVCFVQGRVTPEHRVRSKMYSVLATIDEEQELITSVKCNDCAASEGGCKHAICFIMWLIKRSEEPSVTSVNCYWSRPRLTEAVTKDKFILAKEMNKRKHEQEQTAINITTANLETFLSECKRRNISDTLITNYKISKDTLDKYSLFCIVLEFLGSDPNPTGIEALKKYANELLTDEAKKEIEKQTRNQAHNKLWHSLRQGRITASKIHDASRCNTDGVLVQLILGGYKVPETKAIKRGKLLEGQVIKKIMADMKVTINACGLFLITPFIGASPDGLSDDFTIEIKCPMKIKSVDNYVKNGSIQEKFKAQVQIQMHATGVKKALFCVADPMFEVNEKYTSYWLYYDGLYADSLLKDAECFWEKYIFEKLLQSAKM